MIDVQQLQFKYNKQKTFGPVTMHLGEGKVHVMIGENGAGKSTLIKLMLGELKARTGTLQVPEQINYMPDDLQFPPYLKISEIIKMLQKIKGSTTEGVLEQVGLYDNRNQFVKSLSKGMRQRLNLAQSLIGDAAFIIMDEPTNGLDPLWIFQLQDIIREQKVRGKTLFITTHQLDFAQAIADELYVLRDGLIVHQSENHFEDVESLIKLYRGI
ncbi:ABC transporter ATP-binding protein [Macrococcus armenti]|uniref:ABC transporter ATP-binding protein n=1 Tax=Macrococcus armenti TaxID=2875764 RepID=UPI001CCF2DC9|nr:ABC transporter ATP-binding protein [Macrococcus armenti]UBH14776.1 ABC transporter ATP-binding protein [Macrococcus armenti]UBH17135.1 ABC transporter ATP-binding protein [Macrococcus armenti]UBH19400.1 ABC transporter ATP-binding protein [Macrococcus armenti]